ncbi:MAG: hypothetical protein AAGI14_10965 [Pseudomonadota bacterium]
MSSNRLSGRSTTPARVIPALLLAMLLTPIVFIATSALGSYLITGEAFPSDSLLGSPLNQIQIAFTYAFIFSAPITLVVGGLGWLIAHKTQHNGPRSAILFGIFAATLGMMLLTLLFGLPYKEIEGSYPTSVELLERRHLSNVAWGSLLLSYSMVSIGGIFVALSVWCVGYLGRPERS